MGYEGQIAETLRIHGDKGDVIDAYGARPLGPGPFGGVLVVHHMPGWDEWTREVVRKLAHHGYNAMAPDMHHRQGPGSVKEKAQRVRDSGGQVDSQVLGDLAGAEAHLRRLPTSNGKVGLIGFCSGGRVAYMAAAKMPSLACAVDCWGGSVSRTKSAPNANQPVPPIQMTKDIAVPLLGLFGNDDQNPNMNDVNEQEAELKKHGKTHEFHRYDGAGHAFFFWYGDRYRPAQAMDGWNKAFGWFEKYLR